MGQIIFRYPGQKFVGLATKQADGSLYHSGFTLMDILPKEGGTLFNSNVIEVLTDKELLKERSLCACNDIEAVVVLAKQV